MSSFSCDYRSSGVLAGSAISNFSAPALAALPVLAGLPQGRDGCGGAGL